MSLRLEKSYGTWYREYRPIYTLHEAGLQRYVKLDHEFIGRAAYEKEAETGPERRLVTLVVEPDPDAPADVIGDEPIWHDGEVVGWVTSGSYGHHVGKSIALGYVPTALATPDGPGRPFRDRDHRPAPAGPAPARAAVRPRGPPDAPVSEVTAEADPASAAGGGRIVVDGRPVAFEAGDTVAIAILRGGEVPGRGGTLCLAGDCGNCLAEVDGTAYVRTCQTAARPGLRVARHPADAMPALPVVAATDLTATPLPVDGRAAPSRGGRRGHRRRLQRARRGRRGGAGGQVRPRPRRPCRRGGRRDLRRADDRGPHDPRHAPRPSGRDRRRDGRRRDPSGRARAIGWRGSSRRAPRSSCGPPAWTWAGWSRWTATSCGSRATVGASGPSSRRTRPASRRRRRPTPWPSTSAWRRATSSRGWPAPCRCSVVGDAAADQPLPPPPTEGVVCGCMGTTVADLAAAWDDGFTELELLKRASQACLGPCQGGACLPHVRSWIAARTGEVPDPFTARPGVPPDHPRRGRPRTATSTRSGGRRSTTSTSRSGARMDRFGGWWRPWHYGDAVSEYWAVREGVSIGDVSTLGKLVVSGPDVVELLERIYPCHVADIKPGRSRYALLLNERGHVMDDGMILRESETRFVLSFTSGGAANAEMWLRDWIDVWGLRVHVLDRTMSLAAINVTGPLAGELLQRAGPGRPAALPRPRPGRRRRRAVPRHAPVVHRRGRLRAPPPGRSVGRAVAGAAGPRRRPRASGRTASRRCSGCGSRRATSSSAWTPSSTRRRAGSGWTGRSGWRSRGSSAGRRWSGPPSCPTTAAGSASRWPAPAPVEGAPIWSRRRGRRQRDRAAGRRRSSGRR